MFINCFQKTSAEYFFDILIIVKAFQLYHGTDSELKCIVCYCFSLMTKNVTFKIKTDENVITKQLSLKLIS